MLPGGGFLLRCTNVPFWILTIWGSVLIKETMVWWRDHFWWNLHLPTPGSSLVFFVSGYKYTIICCNPMICPLHLITVWASVQQRPPYSLQLRHNEPNGVSNHRRRYCLRKRLFRHRSKKTSNSASLAFVRGIHRWPVNSLHKWPVTRKMFPFDDVTMHYAWWHFSRLWVQSVSTALNSVYGGTTMCICHIF